MFNIYIATLLYLISTKRENCSHNMFIDILIMFNIL